MHDTARAHLHVTTQFDVLSANSFNYWDEQALVVGDDGSGAEDEAPPAVERVPSNQVSGEIILENDFIYRVGFWNQSSVLMRYRLLRAPTS